MSKVFLVCGRTGEYSDANEWRVCAFVSEVAAQAKVNRCTELARVARAARDDRFNGERETAAWSAAETAAKAEDPSFEMDYTGTTYWLEPLGLLP